MFELTSEYRNRVRYPHQGKFALEMNTEYHKRNALDPVCLSTPVRSWQPGFVVTGTLLAASAHENSNRTTLIIASVLDEQSQRPDFLCGCIVGSAADPTLMQRVMRSSSISPTELLLQVDGSPTVSLGQTLTVSDYTAFVPLYVRAPGWEDLGRSSVLYNETLDQSLVITGMELDSRRLSFQETSAPGWLLTHQLNIRQALPRAVLTLVSQVGNVLTFSQPFDEGNIGDWLRLRLTSYQTQPLAASWLRKIIAVSGNQATVATAPPPTAPGSEIELLEFSYDNAQAIKTNDQSMTMVWDVRLESLIIPNTEIMWSSIRSLPHLVVGLQNQMAVISNKSIINSNNPWVQQGVFEALIVERGERWITCRVRQNSTKRLVINIREPLCLVVWLPNGKEFKTVLSDGQSPQPATPDLQIWATVSLEPVFNTNQTSSGSKPLDQVEGGMSFQRNAPGAGGFAACRV